MRRRTGRAVRHLVCTAWGVVLLTGCDAFFVPLAVALRGKPAPPPVAGDVQYSTLDDDACPDDPDKTEPGACGCGVADDDRDGDGAADCVDDCPDNPNVVQVGARITFAVTFDDPEGAYAAYYDDLEAQITAAGEDWVRHLVAPRDVSIEVLVHFADIYTAHGGSLRSVFRVRDGGADVYEQGVAAEVRTGIDANGEEPDASITVGIGNLIDGRWWFDPDPYLRTTPVPEDRIDAYSTFLHELGHVLAYNGWRRYADGELPGGYASTFDTFIESDGENQYFAGPEAMAVYGGPVPLTFGNIFHVANRAPRPGSDLLDELMNGVADRRGWRRYISALDLAVLTDVGLPVRGRTAVEGCADDVPPAERALAVEGALTGPPVLVREMSVGKTSASGASAKTLPAPTHHCGGHGEHP